MKQILRALALTLVTSTATAAPEIDWRPGKIAAGLSATYTYLCEDLLGGLYGYEQTEMGPTSWRCVTPSNPKYRPIRDIVDRVGPRE